VSDPKWLGFRFYQVDGLVIDGPSIKNQSAWGIKIEDAVEPRVRNTDFDADGSQPNQDGVHVLGPCDNPVVRDIYGVTEDDSVMFGALSSDDVQDGGGGDITKIDVQDVHTSVKSNTNALKLLVGDGFQIEGVSANEISLTDSPNAQEVVQLGPGGFPDTAPSNVDLKDVTLSNVYSDTDDVNLVNIKSACQNVSLVDSTWSSTSNAVPMSVENSCADLSVKNCSFGVINKVVDVPDNRTPTVDGVTIEGVNVGDENSVSEGVIGSFESGVTINNAYISDVAVRNANFVISNGGDMSGTIANIDTTNVGTFFNVDPTGTLKANGGLPPIDVTLLANVRGSVAYNDGSTGTEGPAYNDGAGWTSLVDGTAI